MSHLHLQRVHLEDIMMHAACHPHAVTWAGFRALLLATPTAVRAEPDRHHQMVANRLTNAIKYTHIGGQVWLKPTVEMDEAVFGVEDTGGGIAPEVLPKIFELFTQEDASLEHSQVRLGLRLSVVMELVAGMTVRSKGAARELVHGPASLR